MLASLISVCLCSLVWVFDHMQAGRYVTTTGDVKENVTYYCRYTDFLFQSHITWQGLFGGGVRAACLFILVLVFVGFLF